jgi:hypothetical protein
MSIRNNLERTGPVKSADPPPKEKLQDPMSFVIPTEFVELPSKGQGYPIDHPLHNQDVVEIRHMTAKDEDILTSRSLVKKGVVIDRLIDSLLVDKRIRSMNLLSGDRSAIIIEARKYAYGNEYKTKITCPACSEQRKYVYNLNNKHIHYGEIPEHVEINEKGNFTIKLPRSGFLIEIKRMTGKDEQEMVQRIKKSSRNNHGVDTTLSEQLKSIMVSVNDDDRALVISHFAENMLSSDTKFLRDTYKKINPDVKLKFDFTCRSCYHEQELEVALDADFFWPE